MPYLSAQDTISGQEGKITFTINKTNEFGGYVKKIEARFEKRKTEIKTLGYRNIQHKANGWSGKGTMTLYYITSLFRKHAYDYATKGTDLYFDITIENKDPSSKAGTQVVILRNCNIGTMMLANINVDTETLQEEVEFTFDSFEIPTQFSKV